MTVYGQAKQGTHTAVKVLVGVAGVVVLVAAFVVWRSASSESAAPSTAPSSAPAVPTVPSTSAAAAPVELSTGSWVVSLEGASPSHLTVDGEYAALDPDRRTVFTVVKGLADASCFSFRAADGKYLRHFDYRLRFDKPDDADLFRKDATFCPLDGAPAGVVRLRSANYPDHVIHRRGTELYIDERKDAKAFEADSSFTVERA